MRSSSRGPTRTIAGALPSTNRPRLISAFYSGGVRLKGAVSSAPFLFSPFFAPVPSCSSLPSDQSEAIPREATYVGTDHAERYYHSSGRRAGRTVLQGEGILSDAQQ